MIGWGRRPALAAAILSLTVVTTVPAQELPGVTETEIRIGNTHPYTGPAATFARNAYTFAAFFDMINAKGGVNGRRITFISYDDAYSPPRTIEHVRRLVESDDVLLIFASLGTQNNLAIRDYLNDVGVPQLFAISGASTLIDPINYPWTMPILPSYVADGRLFGQYISENFPEAKVGVLYQNDDLGTDYLIGLTQALGNDRLLAQPYNVADTTVDAQVAYFAAEGAEVFVIAAAPRFAAQSIRRAAEIGWRPQLLLSRVAANVGGTLVPAGIENAIGAISAVYAMDPAFEGFADDVDMIAFREFMAEYYPDGDPLGTFEALAYHHATLLIEVLRRAGDDLSRENVMRIATNLVDLDTPLLIPGIILNTSRTDYSPVEQLQLVRFDGVAFVPFGPLVDTAED